MYVSTDHRLVLVWWCALDCDVKEILQSKVSLESDAERQVVVVQVLDKIVQPRA